MNRLIVRFVGSHLLVAVIGAIATFLVVRQLAPLLFDETLQRGGLGVGNAGAGPGGGGARGVGPLRPVFAEAVDRSLLIGTAVGVVLAAAIGAFAAYRLLRSLHRIQVATRRMAGGDYTAVVRAPAERELAALVQDVNTLGSALAETEARRTRLISEVAHEMRTPLTVIDGYVAGMADGVIPAGAEELAQVSDEVRRLRRLAEDLSSLSRAEESRIQLELEPVDFADVVARAASRLQDRAAAAGIELIVVPPPELLPVVADEDRLAHVITNLVDNAIAATPAGGRIVVESLRAQGAGGVDGIAQARVSDTGEGLSAADLGRVFERFYRAPGRREKQRDGGSGIGLTIARGTMRALGGDLEAASAGPGTGATFTAWMPLAGAAETDGSGQP
ncbi:MAG: HAMP domain-containing histidine kinase [Austwickia sp.]|nr:HAMP domain-containing histidine kinase [Austwickia sp.]MBK8437510.1 HAMP domain-containing histidine kinase [Austwickia sp.]MBK9102776.1 HAMP domain-containing histidine kinase [Austwickia sp.]